MDWKPCCEFSALFLYTERLSVCLPGCLSPLTHHYVPLRPAVRSMETFVRGSSSMSSSPW